MLSMGVVGSPDTDDMADNGGSDGYNNHYSRTICDVVMVTIIISAANIHCLYLPLRAPINCYQISTSVLIMFS